MVKPTGIWVICLVFSLIQGCGIALMYNGTILSDDTKLYARYNTLPIATYPADSVSLSQVEELYFDSWVGKTVGTHDSTASGYLDDVRAWSVPPPYMTGVSGNYHLIWTADELQNFNSRIVSSVPLDSISFFNKDIAETDKCNQYFPAVLESALKRYNKNLAIIPPPPGGNLISSLQELENKKFAGSAYDFHTFPSLNSNTPGRYIMIVTLSNIKNRYWTANAKAHHSIKLNLYIIDKATGQIARIKFLEFLLHLDMRPIQSYPTVEEFKKSKMYRFYLRAANELIAQCFVETKG